MVDTSILPLLLKQLRLPSMLAQWESLMQEAIEEQWSYAEYLSHLCDAEVAARYQNRVARYIRESGLPPGKTLASFDFDSAKSVNKHKIEALASNASWVEKANNVVIFGPSGVGKTHLASAIGHRLIEQGVRVLFTSTTQLVQKMQKAKQEFKLPSILDKLSKASVLILDDIGYVKKDDKETSVLFELIAERYENSSLIITSNQPFGEWNSIFPDNMMAVAAIDRIVHHASIISITDQSYRKAQAGKINQLNEEGNTTE